MRRLRRRAPTRCRTGGREVPGKRPFDRAEPPGGGRWPGGCPVRQKGGGDRLSFVAETAGRSRARPEGAPIETAARPLIPCALALLVPGLGHFSLDRRGTGAVYFGCIGLLFAFGIGMEGELFPLDSGAPLTLLAGLAEMGAGGLYVAAKMLGYGGGDPAATTYEYGYAFLIAAGLLNVLVALDAWDLATGARRAEAAPDGEAGPTGKAKAKGTPAG